MPDDLASHLANVLNADPEISADPAGAFDRIDQAVPNTEHLDLKRLDGREFIVALADGSSVSLDLDEPAPRWRANPTGS